MNVGLRKATYGLFVELGRAPTADEVAGATGGGVDEVRAGWHELHEAHALVLDDRGEIRMANPFSAAPTPYRVEAAGRPWHANCAWDAFGICAALHVGGLIETACADCGGRLEVTVRDGRAGDESLVFHCLVPAAHWWNDIVFT